MARTDTWMPLYIGDYHADTRRLSTLEHGAYLLLLMEYWKQGPLRDDDEELAAIAGLKLDAWRKIAASIRRYFTIAADGLLHQKRVDAERQKALELSEKRRIAGSRKGSKQSANAEPGESGADTNAPQNPSKTPANDGLLLSNCSANADTRAGAVQSQLPSPTLRVSEQDNRSLRSLPQIEDDFDEFWTAYPRKVGKGDAEKAYAKALKAGTTHAAIMAAVAATRWSLEPKYIPHAATWLNGKRWQDDPEAAVPPPAILQPQPGEHRYALDAIAAHARFDANRTADQTIDGSFFDDDLPLLPSPGGYHAH